MIIIAFVLHSPHACRLRCLILSCISTWTRCSASSFLHFYKNLMLRRLVFSCISTWTWCSASWSCISTRTWCSTAWSSLAFLHVLDAPLLDLLLHVYMNSMLCCLIFSCISTWTWCFAVWSSRAFLHELHTSLLDFSCISTRTCGGQITHCSPCGWRSPLLTLYLIWRVLCVHKWRWPVVLLHRPHPTVYPVTCLETQDSVQSSWCVSGHGQ